MAKVVYNDPEGVAESVTFFGHAMTAGQEIEVEDTAEHQAFLDAAEGNPFFSVADRKKLEEGKESLPPVKYENRKLSPYDRGQLAKEDGKPRSVPVFYRGKDESEEWLKGYDGEPNAPAATVSESPTSEAPAGPLSAGSSSAFSNPTGTGQADQNLDFSQGQNAATASSAPRPIDGPANPANTAETGQQSDRGQRQSGDLTGGA
jgi:hypothetical protein